MIARTKLTIRGRKQYVELRDYEFKKAIEKHQSIKIVACESKDPKWCPHIDEERMTLTWRQLRKGHILNTQRSQYNPGQTYIMFEFEWIPDKTEHTLEVEKVSNVIQGLSKFAGTPKWNKLKEKLHA